MEYQGRKIRVNNIDMNVVVAGEGQDVLLVHGFRTHTRYGGT
jgi:hypothetical protein